MTNFHLVTGFLGSGKTTLLKNVLEHYARSRRIAVVQNEFAASSTDGKMLEMTGHPFRLVEINNGSVFCVCILGTFIQTLERVLNEYKPEWIILEASGLSDPINIIELLQTSPLRDQIRLSQIFNVVDALNFERGMHSMPRFRHQIMVADQVLINKKDLYQGDIESLRARIREVNPFATITETSYCRIPLHEDFSPCVTVNDAARVFGKSTSGGRPEMKASVLRIQQRITMEGLDAFIGEVSVKSPRIKGFVNTTEGVVVGVQSVFGTYNKELIPDYHGPTEIIVFSENLTPGLLRGMFVNHTRHEN